MAAHIHMTVGLERNAFILQERTLPLPAGSSPTRHINNTMAGKFLCSRSIAQGTANHTGMTRPSRQSGNETVGHNPTMGYLTNNTKNSITKGLCLLSCHPVGIVLHVALVRVIVVYLVKG